MSSKVGTSRPNIVWIVADQLNTRHLGCYPYPGSQYMHTPTIDALSHSGTTFETAYCQSPLCMPSRAAFHTGLYPSSCRVLHNPVVLAPEFPTLAELLSEAGYLTGGFGHIGGDGLERGYDRKVDLVDSPLRDAYLAEQRYLRGLGNSHPAGLAATHPFPEEDQLDGRTCALACEWISSVTGPFFLEIDFMNPHIPLLAPEPYIGLYDPSDVVLPPTVGDELAGKPGNVAATRRATAMEAFGEERLCESVRHYRALVSYVDALAGRVIEALDAVGALDDTIICFFADHGDYAGDFGMIGKTGNFYDCLTNVPLVVSGPEELVTVGRTADPVGLVDLPPTILDLLGVGQREPMQGRSLARSIGASRADEESRRADGRVLGGDAFCETGGRAPAGAPTVRCDDPFDEADLKPLPTDPYSSGPVSHLYDGEMVRDDRYKLSIYGDGFRELYDLHEDPWERVNLLAGNTAGASGDGEPVGEVERRLLSVLVRRHLECRRPDIPQQPIPYHYRATAAELIPAQYRESHQAWRPQGD